MTAYRSVILSLAKAWPGRAVGSENGLKWALGDPFQDVRGGLWPRMVKGRQTK